MATVVDLGKAVKAKYPGVYDDVPDRDLGMRVRAAYPDAYGDYSDVAAPSEATRVGAEPATNRNRSWGADLTRAALGTARPAGGWAGGALGAARGASLGSRFGPGGALAGSLILGGLGAAAGGASGEAVGGKVGEGLGLVEAPADPADALKQAALVSALEHYVGRGAGAALNRVGTNLARRSYRPTPTLTKRYMKVDGKPVKDRLVKQALSDKVTPSAEGVVRAEKLVDESAGAVDDIVMRMRQGGRKVRLEDIAKPTLEAVEKRTGRALAPDEKARILKIVAKRFDKVLREMSEGAEWAVKRVRGPGKQPATYYKREFDPLVVHNARKAADEAAKAAHSAAASGQRGAVATSAAAFKKVADGARDALRMDPALGKKFRKASTELQGRMGVREMVTNAAASAQPVYLRPTFFPVGVPAPPAVVYGAGSALTSPGFQGAVRGAPASLDALLSFLTAYGTPNPDTTGTGENR